MRILPCCRDRIILLLPLLTTSGYLDFNTVSSLSASTPRQNNHGADSSSQSPPSSSSITRRDWLVTGSVGASGLLFSPPSTSAAADDNDSLPQRPRPRLADEYYNSPFVSDPDAGRSYFPALTPPFKNRATYRYDLGRNSWALEQLLTFANVTATIRCNVIRLKKTGGLWVHSPQWPTGEFCSLLDGIGGPIEHVVLPCNAFEHKAPMKAFIEKYPNAKVWIAPGQYGPLGK